MLLLYFEKLKKSFVSSNLLEHSQQQLDQFSEYEIRFIFSIDNQPFIVAL